MILKTIFEKYKIDNKTFVIGFDNIYMILKTSFEKYKIDNIIFVIGFDNASNNTVFILQLINLCNFYFGSRFFHQRYICHVLNLYVQNGLALLQ